MKQRSKLCVLMLAALLAGCHTADPAGISQGPVVSDRPVQSSRVRESEPPQASEEPSPESKPTPEPELWDPEHRLDIAFTPAAGLELPISGATGYATVKLPLWGELPQGNRGKLTAIYAPPKPSPEPSTQPVPETTPELTPGPAQEPVPEPMPEPTADTFPAPVETEPPVETTPAADEPALQADAAETEEVVISVEMGEGGPAVSVAPTDGAGIEPPMESPLEPTPEPEPVPEPVPDVTTEPAPASTPEPSLEPAFEPTPEPAPEPAPEPDPMEGALAVLEPGAAFTILQEAGDWWQVRLEGGETGWVEHRYCLINLPDVIPSMIYNNTNAYSSVLVSSGKNIPNITGKALYQAKATNPRLGRSEFMMPVLYAMAKNVCQAQQNALAEGNTLVLYEGFQPYDAQTAVVRGLSALARSDGAVEAGISTAPWNISWFVATGPSNQQEGCAIDVSLAKVTRAHVGDIGGYSVVQVDEYEEYAMPTPIHELSMAAATYTKPVAIFSTTAWRSAEMAPAMAACEPAKALQRYCTDAKLTPMASEWWRFNDLAAYSQIRAYHGTGNFEITACLSTAPDGGALTQDD